MRNSIRFVIVSFIFFFAQAAFAQNAPRHPPRARHVGTTDSSAAPAANDALGYGTLDATQGGWGGGTGEGAIGIGSVGHPPAPSTVIHIAEQVRIVPLPEAIGSPRTGAATRPVTATEMREAERLMRELVRLNAWQIGLQITVEFVQQHDGTVEARIHHGSALLDGGLATEDVVGTGTSVVSALRDIVMRRQAEVDAIARRERERQRAVPTYRRIVVPPNA